MSKKIQHATKNLDYCVHSVMADINDTTTKHYQQFLKWGFDAYRELNLFSLPQIKTRYLTMSANRTVELPDDYVNYTAIGINIGGQYWLLTRNDGMALRRTEDCPTDIQSVSSVDTTILPYSYEFSGYYRNGQYVGEQYAVGGGWNTQGYYRIDTELGRIQFSSVVPNAQIVLEYKSTGVDCDGTVEIPYQAITAVVAYIHWKRVQNDENKRRSGGEIADRKKDWTSAFNNLKHYNLMFTMQEYLDSKWSTIKSTPRR